MKARVGTNLAGDRMAGKRAGTNLARNQARMNLAGETMDGEKRVAKKHPEATVSAKKFQPK